jgi:hypothetical protein
MSYKNAPKAVPDDVHLARLIGGGEPLQYVFHDVAQSFHMIIKLPYLATSCESLIARTVTMIKIKQIWHNHPTSLTVKKPA